MTQPQLNPVAEILQSHNGDNEQCGFITTLSKKVILQAPAGYGKTKTMVSKLAYLISTNQILSPKKVLALTFSVNAAYKIKKDVVEQLPKILQGNEGQLTISLNSIVSVSNYHGFCRKVLSRYGYLLHENLRKVNEFVSFDDSRDSNITRLNLGTTADVVIACTTYSERIKLSDRAYLLAQFNTYNNHVLQNFVPNNFIPFNSILTLTLKLFHEHPNILAFYQKLYPVIIVDEFQDTNFFGYALLKKLISDNTSLYLVGDALQRIYGFIGAIPNILEDSKEVYGMEVVLLKQNYRFMNNPNMLLLDGNIRKNAENLIYPQISENAQINLAVVQSQDEEALYVIGECQRLLEIDATSKVAILFRLGYNNRNTQRVIEEFDSQGINYFYGLFSDEDDNYKDFHFECAIEFSNLLKQLRLSKRTCKKHISNLKAKYGAQPEPVYNSLISLLEIFYNRLYSEYSFLILDDEDKLILIRDTFDGFGLKQYMEYVDSNIIISTIHGAKGLEWDYVIMPDMEQYSLPSWFGFCGDCPHKNGCQLNPGSASPKFLEELSVFYVGFTRARKEVFFSASRTGIGYNGVENRNLSCFLQLPGIAYLK